MNELFVNIKVDREERPDLDSIYMQAVQAYDRARRLAHDRVPHPGRSPSMPERTFHRTIARACPPFAA